MKKTSLIILIFALFSCSGQDFRNDVVLGSAEFPGVAKQQYVLGTEDLPVYYGFKASSDANVSYDTIDGRIVDAAYTSDVAAPEDVRVFYETVLPQLGWSKQEYQLYKREGEILRINIVGRVSDVLLKFAIRPSKQ